MKTDLAPLTARAPSPWLPYLKSRPTARLRLFCFPYAAGSAVIFRNWIDFFGPYVEVCAVQLPGRGTHLREPAFTKMGPLLEAVTAGIADWLDKPFAFFGHSMGASISFELAHKLRAERGLLPAHLFVSGRSAPQIVTAEPLMYDLPEPELIARLRQLEGTPSEILENQELLALVLPLIRSDFEVIETYRYVPKPKLTCSITALGGIADTGVSPQDIQAWQEQSSTGFYMRMFSGNHFFLHSAEKELLEVMAQSLEYTTRGL